MVICLRKYLGKLEYVEKFNLLIPLQIACRMRQSSMEGDGKWHKLTKNDKNNCGIEFGSIMWGWSAIKKLKISKNEIFVLCIEIIHKNLAAVQKNSIFQHVLTYPGTFSVKWPSIPMFYTCKKTYPSVLSAHQIWAWYLKACQKKVGCQNYCGLWDTL